MKRSKTLRALAALLGCALAVPVVAARGDEREGEWHVVGELPVATADFGDSSQTGWTILNPKTRRAYEVFERLIPFETVIQSYDLDTLQPRRRLVLPGMAPMPAGGSLSVPVGAAVSGELVHGVDEDGGRIFLPVTVQPSAYNTVVVSDGSSRIFDHVVVIEEHAFDSGAATATQRLDAPATQPFARINGLKGMRFTRQGGREDLIGLWSSTSRAGVYDHWLSSWDVSTSVGPASIRNWALPLTDCGAAPLAYWTESSLYQLAILPAQGKIFTACQSPGGGAFSTVTQVVEVGLDPAGNADPQSVKTYPLARRYADSVVDPANNRLIVRAIQGGATWWWFDTATRQWSGAVASTNHEGYAVAAGLDPATGRLYTLVPNYTYLQSGRDLLEAGGLLYTDGGLTPVPQAASVRPDLAYPGMFRILVDPARDGRPRRVFVRRGSPVSKKMLSYPQGSFDDAPIQSNYLVIEDNVPQAEQPGLGDVDRYTTDVEESEGKTAVNFDASASGYGLRYLLIGGASALTNPEAKQAGSACIAPDRELVAGTVENARLSTLVASAAALGVDADATTVQDLGRPARRCWANPEAAEGLASVLNLVPGYRNPPEQVDAAALPWKDSAAECAGDKDEDNAAASDRTTRFHAKVNCQQAANKVEASGFAAAGDGSTDAGISVAQAESVVSIARLAGGGVKTTVVSTARGVVIPDVGRIDLVRTEAIAETKGRPKTASGKFDRQICGVEIAGYSHRGCGDEEQVVSALNRALKGRGQARLRQPDKMLSDGSPGGFLAAVQKPQVEEFSDTVVTKDSSKAVPGLEIIFYRDDPTYGAGREVIQLAGAQASSSYGIYLLSSSGPDGEEGGGLDGDVAAPGTEPGNIDIPGTVGESGGGGSAGGSRRRGGLAGALTAILGRPLLLRSLIEGLFAAAVWFALGSPLAFAIRRQSFIQHFRPTDTEL